MQDKVIVTHRAALTAKYGQAGIKAIQAALAALVEADKERGLAARIVYLDDAPAMKKLGAPTLANHKDRRGAKQAIDGVYKSLKPDYLLIVGASDVIPHQDLTNPAFEAGDDDDEFAFGDIPYACDEPYSRDPAKFVGPTRVVGRLPDLTGAGEPSHLIALLKTAAQWKSRKLSDYKGHFGLSAAVWRISTDLSLDAIFGQAKPALLSPPKGPSFTPKALGALMHFVNCHGAVATPEFYGQTGDKYPTALTTKSLKGKIRNGTVASVECCYGAELYNSVLPGIDIPICQTYLRQGAYGYLGSTTIAYGPADENGAADLICQYFLRNILEGASIGRAALMARQQIVAKVQQMDPMDLKTLAQFCLYGDPSIHPILEAVSKAKPSLAHAAETNRFRRSEIRAKLKQTGDFLQATKPTASKPEARRRPTAKEKPALAKIAAAGGLSRNQPFTAYKVKGSPPPRLGKKSGKKAAPAPTRYYLTIGRPRSKRKDGPKIAIIAKEVQGRIVDYRIYHQR
ncbi:C25 family cysteine peptidase [Taklimakanibacter lacteus]|uniref:C25 family cysteine peptidase n=1 Tax=Taklimakanibacter lacteus TaxID=2268456 RepID=UPI0013C51520